MRRHATLLGTGPLGLALGLVACASAGESDDRPGGTGGATGGASTGAGGSGGAAATGGSTTSDAALPAGSGGRGADGSDAGSPRCEEFVMPADCTIPEGAVLPGELRCTGLYADWGSRTLRCGVESYRPAYELWSDGAGKQRYVWLPPGTSIDAQDPENFVYPVGTRFWKEFHVGSAGRQRLGETRYLLKVKGGWLYTTYVWADDGSHAIQANDGVANLYGSGHGVPTREQCKTCHSGRPDFVLGWDFVMLGAGASGITAAELARRGQLVGFDATLLDLAIPGDATERNALSYMHANCGVSCHNQTPNAEGKPSGLFLRLDTHELGSVLATDAATSGINRLPSPNAEYGELPIPAGDFYDFRPLDPERSLSVARMTHRGSMAAMPPIGTHQIDRDGVDALTAWVLSMTPARGYPAPAP